MDRGRSGPSEDQAQNPRFLQGPRLSLKSQQGNLITVAGLLEMPLNKCPEPYRFHPSSSSSHSPTSVYYTQSISRQPPVSHLLSSYNLRKKKKITIQENTPTHLAQSMKPFPSAWLCLCSTTDSGREGNDFLYQSAASFLPCKASTWVCARKSNVDITI